MMDGKTNNTGTITLATGNATTTTISDPRISRDSMILLVPKSAAAFADTAPYGAFQSTADQTIASATTAYAMTLDTTDFTNGVYLSNSSRINVRNAGVYNFQWSGQFENTDSQDHDVNVWIRKNGTDIVGSNGLIAVPSKHGSVDGHIIVGWNYFIEFAANDYLELYWSAASTLVSLQFYAAGSSPTKPSTASLITTMQYIAPNSLDNVYVSAQTNGSATLTHFANSTASKTYGYVIVG
jgi:hypothetical protein